MVDPLVGSTGVTREPTEAWLIDMDGVLVREEQVIEGADRFIGRLVELDIPFLVLTNNSIYTPSRPCAPGWR